ncbi:hypothetical protein [Allokutzneria oryzae]|uniref:Uncharacterized protein n=1 Tax=Allokutzneria oryzae TaxID=1378989 RepID=A0ABV5ZWZ1_9PSEU
MKALELHRVNSWEAAFPCEEVRGCFAHRVAFSPRATVPDAGANIGMVSVERHAPDAEHDRYRRVSLGAGKWGFTSDCGCPG